MSTSDLSNVSSQIPSEIEGDVQVKRKEDANDLSLEIEKFQIEMGLHNETEWDECHNSEKVKIWKKNDPQTGMWKMKIVGTIEVSPDLVHMALHSSEYRKSWDKVIGNIDVLEETEEYSILHISSLTPIGIANRDFVHKRVKKMTEKGQIVLDVSVETDKRPPSPSFVRAHTYFSAALFEMIEIETTQEQGTRFTTINQVDVKGTIPKWLVNLVTSKSLLQWFLAFEQACKNLKKSGTSPSLH